MKKLLIAVVMGIMLVGLVGTPVLADDPEDPINVDIVIIGNDPVVTVGVDGNGATIFINGQDLAKPTVIRRTKIKNYYIENPYDDAALKGNIHSLEIFLGETGTILAVTNNGLAKIILVIGEHTDNLRELLEMVSQNAESSISRDNELGIQRDSQDLLITQWVEELERSLATHKITTSESISDLETNYQNALATALVSMDTRVDKLSSDFNAKLLWTWSGVGVFGLLLLGIWRLWQVRLNQD